MTRPTFAVGILTLLLVLPYAPAHGSDRKPPKISKAVMTDKDGDGFSDRVVLNYTEKIDHRVDDDGVYPFRVVGYKILRIKHVSRSKQLTLVLAEKTKTDPGAAPNVLYDRGRDEAVLDTGGNEARTQTFKGTKPFVRVPDGSSLLIVNVEGPGSVATLDGTFACATSCFEVVDAASVVLSAAPDDGAAFNGWAGACESSGTSNPCLLVMDGNKTVEASFATARR